MTNRVILFVVPGPPKGKQRARTGKGFAYTPKQTVMFENYVKLCFSGQYPGFTPHDGPVRMEIRAFFPIAKSKPKYWRELCSKIDEGEGGVPFTSSPDWDNCGKIVCDALNKIAYNDDRQVFSCLTTKFYSPRPRIEIKMELLPPITREEPILVPL